MKDAAAVALGRTFVGAAVLASGVLQIVTGDFVRLVRGWPGGVPGSQALAYATGGALVAAGAAILAGRLAREAATLLALLLAATFAAYLPQFFVHPEIDRPLLRGFMYTNPLKTLALVGGAALVSLSLRGAAPGRPHSPAAATPPAGERLVEAVATIGVRGHVLLAVFMIVCGLQHFAYRRLVAEMVPAYMPARMLWTYFTGVALVAGGVGMLTTRFARLAATLSGVMIFLWVVMLHVPRALAGPAHANETAGVFEALAISGVALLVAGTRPAAR